MTPDEIIFPSRVVLLDEQRSFTDALTLALSLTGDLRVVAAAQDAADGFRAIEASQPDLIVTDYRLNGSISGIELATRVREAEGDHPWAKDPTPIVVLTAFLAPIVPREANELTYVSILSKQSAIADIVAGLRRAVLRRSSVPPVICDPYHLSPAELEVLEHLAMGMTATTIATELCLSVHAIRARIRGLLTKTDSTSQLEAVTKATRAGLVVPPPFEGSLNLLADTA